MTEHMLLVEKQVYDAYVYGMRTQHDAVDYETWTRASEIEVGDTFKIMEIRNTPIYFEIKEIYKKRLHDITQEEIERAGYPDMSINNIHPFVYADTKMWYERVWDYLHPFKSERWKKNPQIVIYVLEKES